MEFFADHLLFVVCLKEINALIGAGLKKYQQKNTGTPLRAPQRMHPRLSLAQLLDGVADECQVTIKGMHEFAVRHGDE
jgi:hypothetical protein